MNRLPTTETFTDPSRLPLCGITRSQSRFSGLTLHDARLVAVNPSGQNPTVVNYGYNEDNSLTSYNIVAPGRQLNVAFTYSGGLRVAKQVTGFVTVGGQQQVYNTHKKYLLDGVDVLVELQVIGSNEVVTVLNIPGVAPTGSNGLNS